MGLLQVSLTINIKVSIFQIIFDAIGQIAFAIFNGLNGSFFIVTEYIGKLHPTTVSRPASGSVR